MLHYTIISSLLIIIVQILDNQQHRPWNVKLHVHRNFCFQIANWKREFSTILVGDRRRIVVGCIGENEHIYLRRDFHSYSGNFPLWIVGKQANWKKAKFRWFVEYYFWVRSAVRGACVLRGLVGDRGTRI